MLPPRGRSKGRKTCTRARGYGIPRRPDVPCSEEDGVLHFDKNTAGLTTRTTAGTAGCMIAPYLVLQ
jgi:hypothetical protein